ncbi:MAG: AAA family ATPase [Candidatus Thorarchaeota archaeon]
MKKLSSEEIRVQCEERAFACKTSAELFPLDNIVGQNRALEALRFGLMIEDKGFNVYVAGIPGTGRTTAVLRFVSQLAAKKHAASDWCFVTNFEDQYHPRALELPAGRGWQLAMHMESFIDMTQVTLAQMLESEEYITQRNHLYQTYRGRQQQIGNRMEEEALLAGFVLQRSKTGLVILPVVNDTPLTEEMLENLPEKARTEIEGRRNALEKEMRTLFRKMRGLEQDLHEALQKMEREAVQFVLSPLIDDVEEKFRDLPKVSQWIRDVAEDITDNLHIFIGLTEADPVDDTNVAQTRSISSDEFSQRYHVNLIADNVGADGAPVVILANPSYSNLFGTIEKEPRYGGLKTDFTMIRPGALQKANGGYLIIPARELLSTPNVYHALKRALEHGEIVIDDPPVAGGLFMAKSLRPEPIPLEVKVVLIGEDAIYRELYDKDPEFRQLFKVKAEFDTTMARTPENVNIFGSFICMIHKKEGVRSLRVDSIAEIIDYSSRLAENQKELSIRFDIISDIIREANFYAGEDGSVTIEREHIKRTLEQRVYRLDLYADRLRRLVENDIILLDLEGEAVGQVNGLSIATVAGYSFGQVSRITASASPGYGRVLDIERESNLAGPIHTKGVLILGGYLANKYGEEKPISLSARIVFEQSYGAIDGDSASTAELYAILSALSGIPVQQRFAVTGSVNQHGTVQAVGGINEKIEGFFQLCKVKGLTGHQGILIPKANIQNLMLGDDVVGAVRAGSFHIYAIETVDEGIELVTGVPAGVRQDNGKFPPETINGLVDANLSRMTKIMEKYLSSIANHETYP